MKLIASLALNYLASTLLVAALQSAWPDRWDRVLIACIVGGLFVGAGALAGKWGSE